jgi:hypothetical protein
MTPGSRGSTFLSRRAVSGQKRIFKCGGRALEAPEVRGGAGRGKAEGSTLKAKTDENIRNPLETRNIRFK